MNEENKNVTPETNPEKVENVQETIAEETTKEVVTAEVTTEEVAVTEETDKEVVATETTTEEAVTAEEIAAETVAPEQKTGIKGFFKKIFNKKNLKWLIISGVSLLLVIALATFFIVRSCSGNDKDVKAPKGYLTLNAYSITLYEGQTYELDVTKINEDGDEGSIKEISYTSEAPLVASVEDGTITAVKEGATYVQISADGLATSCFVTVEVAPEDDGFEIKILEDVLYKGIPTDLYVYVTENGVVNKFTGDVTWSVEDQSALSIVDGKVTALKVTDGTKIFANFTYKDTEQNIELTVKVEEPYVYSPSSMEISLASATTLSGGTNGKHLTTLVTIERFNPVTKEKVTLTANDYTASSRLASIAGVETEGNALKITANSVGNTSIDVPITGMERSVAIKVNVVNTIATVADMDALSIAVHRTPELLSDNFIMVNDIDYNGQVIYPIATAYEPYGTKPDIGYSRIIGIQWKYILETEDVDGVMKYKYVDRDKVGKKKDGTNAYYGLTDKQFMKLSDEGGINPDNKYQFKGTFDGNGYSIKNAKLMNDAFMRDVVANFNSSKVKLLGTFPSIFTYMNGGTVKNVSFVNIKLQSLDDFECEGWTDSVKPLYQYYCPNKNTAIMKTDAAVGEVVDGYRNFNVAAMAWGGATFKNVYVDMDFSSLSGKAMDSVPGGLIHWGKFVNVSNCVVSIRNADSASSRYSFYNADVDSSGIKGTYNNNLSIGTGKFGADHAGALLENGNAWNLTEDWNDLKTLISSTDIISTFDAKVWDMTDFIAGTGAPKLKNGCAL